MLNNEQTIYLHSKGYSLQVSNIDNVKEYCIIDNKTGLVTARSTSKVMTLQYMSSNNLLHPTA